MKEWENKILTDKKKQNTYVAVSNGQRWLCKLIKGDYLVMNGLDTKLKNISKVIKL